MAVPGNLGVRSKKKVKICSDIHSDKGLSSDSVFVVVHYTV